MIRWLDTETGEYQQRLLAASMLQQSMTGAQMAAWLMHKLQVDYHIPLSRVHCAVRDGAAVNGVATAFIRQLQPLMFDIICSSHSAALAGHKFNCPLAKKFVSLWVVMMAHSNIARQMWLQIALVRALIKSNVRWGSEWTLIKQLYTFWSAVKALINNEGEFAKKTRAELKEFLVPEVEFELLLELALILDCGKFIFDFVYLYEGDGFITCSMWRAKELLLTGVAAIVEGHNTCPNLLAEVDRQSALGRGEAADLLAITCGKAHNVLLKLESMWREPAAGVTRGKLYSTFVIYEGMQLLNPHFLRTVDIGPACHALIDKILTLPVLAVQQGLRDRLINELAMFYVLSENVPQDAPLLSWWFGVRAALPTWYKVVVAEAVIMQPTSATAERVFSMMTWMFGDDQRAALEDYKETAMMLRYNGLQRQRVLNAPVVVEL